MHGFLGLVLGSCLYSSGSEKQTENLNSYRQWTEEKEGFILVNFEKRPNGWRLRGKHPQTEVEIWAYTKEEIMTGRSGDTLWVKNVKEISSPLNPREFDYKKWSFNKGVQLQGQLSRITNLNSPSLAMRLKRSGQSFALKWEELLDEELEEPILNQLSKGLCLGFKSALASDQLQVFADTGTLHITAVSGLHVGIVAALIMGLIPAVGNPTIRLMRSILIVALVWLFVAVTGWKTSACRAGTMFTVFQMGWSIRRQVSPVNTLGLVAMLMLGIRPSMLLDVGFQLSFSAVLSIILFYDVFNFSEWVKNQVARYILQLVAVSIAVQVLIAPISMYYFHQFPILFLAGNLIAIPLSALVVGGNIFALITYALEPDLARGIWMFLEGVTESGMFFLSYLQSIDWAVLRDIYCPFWGPLFALVSLSTWGWKFNFNQRMIRLVHLIIILGISAIIYQDFYEKRKDEIVIYAGMQDSRIDLYQGGNLWTLLPENSKDYQITEFQKFKRPDAVHSLRFAGCAEVNWNWGYLVMDDSLHIHLPHISTSHALPLDCSKMIAL